MKTIIAGSRSCHCMLELELAVRKCGWPISEVISGAANGADKLGVTWAGRNGVPIVWCPANWIENGRRAGFIRNGEMAEKAEALIALWDGESRGTKHMIDIATARGLRVHIEMAL